MANLDQAINSGKQFLDTVDEYLSQNIKTATCDDLFRIFDSFRVRMRRGRGGVAGVHGLSEYLIIRFLSYLLGGDFTTPQPEQGELSGTCLHPLTCAGRQLILTQGMPAIGRDPDGRDVEFKPDLGLWRGSPLKSATLVAAAEIKNWPSDRMAIRKDAERLSYLASRWPNFRGLFILLPALNGHQSWVDELEQATRRYSGWFRFLVLEENNASLASELAEKLALDRLEKQSET